MLIPLPPPHPASLLRKRPHPQQMPAVGVSRTSAAAIVAPEEMSRPTPKRRCFRLADRRVHDAQGASSASDVTPNAKKYVPRRKLDLGAFYMPKEGRGEDAHFVNRAMNAFGVADGVGGWAQRGIDAGEFSRQLMSLCEAELEAASCCSTAGGLLEGVLERALARTTARGTSTACVAAVDGQLLRAVNMGDSGFLVVRGNKVVYHSAPQKGGLNRPYQVGRRDGGDPPEKASRVVVQIEPGDIVVAGTDGLFDNLFDAEITDVLARAKAEGHGTPEEMARAVAWAAVEAYVVGQETPFSVACREAKASQGVSGGKLDDVTVVVASVW